MSIRALTLAAVLSLFATASFADDASYCKDLNATAKTVTSGGGSTVPSDVAGAMTKCDAGSIATMEKYITDNKGTLPKRN
jgi:hypothetical protein